MPERGELTFLHATYSRKDAKLHKFFSDDDFLNVLYIFAVKWIFMDGHYLSSHGMNTTAIGKATGLIVLLGVLLTLGSPARAELSNEELAKQAQNPVANLISVPFQDNINFNVGPEDKTQNVLNIQPVIPVSLDSRLEPDHPHHPAGRLPARVLPREGRTNGLGDTQFTAFLSPAKSKGLIWGVGPIVQLPTNTDKVLGNDRWGLGPSAVVLRIEGHWVYGALANNVWSVSNSNSRSAATTTSCFSRSSTTIFPTGCI